MRAIFMTPFVLITMLGGVMHGHAAVVAGSSSTVSMAIPDLEIRQASPLLRQQAEDEASDTEFRVLTIHRPANRNRNAALGQ